MDGMIENKSEKKDVNNQKRMFAEYLEPVYRFNEVVNELRTTFINKNNDYGNSFDKSLDKFGLVAAAVRMSDKLERFSNLITKVESKVTNESISDTIKDLANYAIMTAMYIDNNNKYKDSNA